VKHHFNTALLIYLASLLMSCGSKSDEKTNKILSLVSDSSEVSFSWLTGTWRGEGFGGILEEVWSIPDEQGTIMGMFRHIGDSSSVSFYEFWVLDSLGMKLKHYSPELIGWEEKDDYVTFEKVSFEKGKVILKGLTYEQRSENEMVITLKLKNGDKIDTEVFQMKRVK
jgi:hypothetical protein